MIMLESERASNDMADSRKRIAELEGENAKLRDSLLASVATLREALEKAFPYLPSAEEDRRHSLECTCQICDKDRLVELIEAALSNQAATEALERVRNLAKAEVLEEIIAPFRTGLVSTHWRTLIEIMSDKAAELRGGE